MPGNRKLAPFTEICASIAKVCPFERHNSTNLRVESKDVFVGEHSQFLGAWVTDGGFGCMAIGPMAKPTEQSGIMGLLWRVLSFWVLYIFAHPEGVPGCVLSELCNSILNLCILDCHNHVSRHYSLTVFFSVFLSACCGFIVDLCEQTQ